MKYKFINRDVSWLTFNYRVLEEAKDSTMPLYERIKFLAIYSNNLEEFYRVRVSYYRQMLRKLSSADEKFKQIRPDKTISKINNIVSLYQTEFAHIFEQKIIPELEKNKIKLLSREDELVGDELKFINNVFNCDVLPNLQPVILVKNKVRPFLKTGQIYLVLKMFSSSRGNKVKYLSKKGIPKYGLIKLPTDHNIARFFELPVIDGIHKIIFLEDIVMKFIYKIFPGYYIADWYSVKMTRDGDLEYDEEEGAELIDIIENISYTRQLGKPNRFQYDIKMPHRVLSYLSETFELTSDDLVKAGTYHNFRDFFSFPNPLTPKLENPSHIPLRVKELDEASSLIDVVAKKEFLLHFPYQSFNYFIRFLNEAANDDTVEEIMSTQYRVASNSAIVNALKNAALHNKKVTVFVELKARFDEEANLKFAQEMKKAGINIIYSIPGLKVHSKTALIIRKVDGKRIVSAFMATGNFNEKTAQLYCDHGFFTSDKKITLELESLFRVLKGEKKDISFKHLLIPNYNMIDTYCNLINNEIKNAKKGKKGYIIVKVNGLDDPFMIERLYEASLAGVKVDCIVRGVCCLKPNQKYSENIRVIRIVDDFLEHARVFVFHNNDDPFVYMGSADWMRRNLYKRIECVFPIYDKDKKKEVIDILKIQLTDNVKASLLDENAQNIRIENTKKTVRSQKEILLYLQKKAEEHD